jgi:hypothetical protein
MRREKKASVVRAFGTQTRASLYTWYQRLAHIDYDTIIRISRNHRSNIQLSDHDRPDYKIYALYKLKQDLYTLSLRAKKPEDLININLVPSITLRGYNGKTGFITFTEAVTKEDTIKTIKNRRPDPIKYIKDFTVT